MSFVIPISFKQPLILSDVTDSFVVINTYFRDFFKLTIIFQALLRKWTQLVKTSVSSIGERRTEYVRRS